MRLILTGCEYAGKSTLAAALSRWGQEHGFQYHMDDHFTVPALTPVFWNLVIIGGLVIGVPRVEGNNELYVYAGAILAATFVQLVLPVPWLRGLGGRIQFVFDWRDPAVRRVFVLMIPVTLGLGLGANLAILSLLNAVLLNPWPASSRL